VEQNQKFKPLAVQARFNHQHHQERRSLKRRLVTKRLRILTQTINPKRHLKETKRAKLAK
jgi:hypothetical protein